MIEFILATAGLTYIVTQSRLFLGLRESFKRNPEKGYTQSQLDGNHPEGFIYDFLSCPLCFGFWAGAFVWMLQGGEFGYLGKTMFLQACIGAISSYFIYLVISFLKKL